MDEWAHFLRPQGEIEPQSGEFLDEYDQKVKSHSNAWSEQLLPNWTGLLLSWLRFIQRCRHYYPLLIRFRWPVRPVAFSTGSHFGKEAGLPTTANYSLRTLLQSMNIKRFLEAKAGNVETFARSYLLPSASAVNLSIPVCATWSVNAAQGQFVVIRT